MDPQLPNTRRGGGAMTQHARLKRPYDMLKEAATVLPPRPSCRFSRLTYAPRLKVR